VAVVALTTSWRELPISARVDINRLLFARGQPIVDRRRVSGQHSAPVNHSGRVTRPHPAAGHDPSVALALVLVLVLVLEIQIEPAGVADLWHALAEEWPPYLASVTNFRTVGGVWRGDAALRGHRVPAVAARAVFLPGGEAGVTLRRHITPGG
jgi:hypothetical protein